MKIHNKIIKYDSNLDKWGMLFIMVLIINSGYAAVTETANEDEESLVVIKSTRTIRRNIIESDTEECDDESSQSSSSTYSEDSDAADSDSEDDEAFRIIFQKNRNKASYRTEYQRVVDAVKTRNFSTPQSLNEHLNLHHSTVNRKIKLALEKGHLTSEDTKLVYASTEKRDALMGEVAVKIKNKETRTAIFEFYNQHSPHGIKLCNHTFSKILRKLCAKQLITPQDASYLTWNAKPIGVSSTTKENILAFLEEYRAINNPTSSWKGLYEIFMQTQYGNSIAEETFRSSLKKLLDQNDALTIEQIDFIKRCKDSKSAHYPAHAVGQRARRHREEELVVQDHPVGQFKKRRKDASLEHFAQAVQSGNYTTRDGLQAELRYAPTTVSGLFSKSRKNGLLTEEQTNQFNSVVQNAFRLQVAELVKNKASETEILAFCQQHENNREKTDHYLSRNYLRGILEFLYKNNQLTSKDADYLKFEGTVVGRRGETKNKILQFLTEISNSAPTGTRKELADKFNDFTNRGFDMRPIDVKTFAAHVNELIKANRLTDDQVAFFNACKEQKQQDGYVPTSARYNR